ncbi:MAG: ribonuclease HII [Patescibacteria group bacterium]
MSKSYIIGIDEVGRGSLAGPVAVAAALIPSGLKIGNKELKVLRDSKKLSPSQREKWFKYFSAGPARFALRSKSGGGGSSSGGKNHPQISYTVSKVYPRKIEKINISRAANLAALRAFLRLSKTYNLKPSTYSIFLDGGLYLGNGKNRISGKGNPSNNSGRITVKTVIRGDEKIPVIKIASIIAKVSRDAQMRRLAKKYPSYGFEIHKGYGTKMHLAAIKKFGPSKIHRLTFIHKYPKMN